MYFILDTFGGVFKNIELQKFEKCSMCNESIPVDDMSNHENSKKHKFLQLLRKSNSTKKDDDEKFGKF